MKKLLSVILAITMFASVMTGMTLTVGAGFEDEALALYDFTVADSDYVPADEGQRVDASTYVNPLGFNAYLAMDNNTNNNTTVLSYFKHPGGRTPSPKGLAFGINDGTAGSKGRVTLTYAIPEASEDTETMVYEFSVLGQGDMRATAFGLSTADATTIANEMTNVAVVTPTSNGSSGGGVPYDSYISSNRLFLARFTSGGETPNLFSSADNNSIGTLKGPQVASGSGNGYNGYNVRIEYTPGLAEDNLYIAMKTYNNVSTDSPSDEYSTTVTVDVPEGDNPWPTHLFAQTTHGVTGSDKACDLRYLRVYDKALESQLAVTDVEISANVLAVEKGSELQLKAKVMAGSIEQTGAAVEWGIDEAPEGVSISETGILSVAEDANVNFGDFITVTAENSDVKGAEYIKVLGPQTIIIDGNKAVSKNSKEIFTTKVFADDLELTVLTGVDWSIVTPDTGATIDENGIITVPADTTADAITVQATSKYNEAAFGQYTIGIVPEGTPLYAKVDFEDAAALPSIFDAANIVQVDGRDGNVYKVGAGTTQGGGVNIELDRYATVNTMAKASFDYMTDNFPESASLFTIRDHNESGNPMSIGGIILSDHNSIVETENEDTTTGVFKMAGISGMMTSEWYHFNIYAYPSGDKDNRAVFVEVTGVFADSEEVQTKTTIATGRRDNNPYYAKVVRLDFGTGYAGGTSPRGDNSMYLDNISVSEVKPAVDVEIKGEYELGGSVKITSPAADISNVVLSEGNNSTPFDFARGVDLQLTVKEGYIAKVTVDGEEEIYNPATQNLLTAADTKAVAENGYQYTIEFVPTTNYAITSVVNEEDAVTAVKVKCFSVAEEAAKVFVASYDVDGACIEVASGAIEAVNVGGEATITLAKPVKTDTATSVKAFIISNNSLSPLTGEAYIVK